MKELFSAFSAAVFYPLISFVLPGLTAISGWFLLSFHFDSFRWVVSHNHTETAFTLMLLSIFLGIVIDDIGMRIESLWLDRRRDARTCGTHHQEWWAYLRKPFAIEPSGRRHLRYLIRQAQIRAGGAGWICNHRSRVMAKPVDHPRPGGFCINNRALSVRLSALRGRLYP
jgi:hypothetical protein